MSQTLRYELAVIGGGPAGLAAAARAAKQGTSVVLIEENAHLGGKLRGQLHQEPNGNWWIGWSEADRMGDIVADSGITVLTETVAWSIEPGFRVRLTSSRGGRAETGDVRADAVLVATGAVERSLPVPGWTLPGVMTIGCAQMLTNIHRVRPGARALVVGVDPLSMTIGRAMRLGGTDVQGIVLPPEGTPESSPAATLRRLSTLSALAPYRYMRWGGRLLSSTVLARLAARVIPRALPLWSIPLRLTTRLVRIIGEESVTAVEVERVRANGAGVPGTRRIIETDAVCLSNGLEPLGDLLEPTGAAFVRSAEVGGRVPIHSATGRTSVPGLFVAGNAAGIEGAKVAMKQGEIAGGEILDFLDRATYRDRERETAELRSLRAVSEFNFQPRIQEGLDEIDKVFHARAQVGPLQNAHDPAASPASR